MTGRTDSASSEAESVTDYINRIAACLSEFCQCTEVRRTGEIAEIIVEYWEGDPTKPIRLLGFTADAKDSDFEIQEQGYEYLQDFIAALRDRRARDIENG